MKPMKKIAIFIALFFIILLIPDYIEAKVLPQTKNKVTKSTPYKTSTSTVTVSPKLRKDRQALIVYFSNLQNAKSVSYTLIYSTNGQQEAAGGSITPSGQTSTSRELLFGTCSKNVCRYHTNLSNMRLEVNADLKSGKKMAKRYRIKI